MKNTEFISEIEGVPVQDIMIAAWPSDNPDSGNDVIVINVPKMGMKNLRKFVAGIATTFRNDYLFELQE
jgi:hypothetical protein